MDLEDARKISSLIIASIFYFLKACAKAEISDYIDAVELDFTGVNYTTQTFNRNCWGDCFANLVNGFTILSSTDIPMRASLR